MKKGAFLVSLILIFAAELAAVIVFAYGNDDGLQDAVAVNEAWQSVQSDWGALEQHTNHTGLDYVVLDEEGTVLYRTKEGLSESINQAVVHRDTILDIDGGIVQDDIGSAGTAAGKMILYNDSGKVTQRQKRTAVIVLSAAIFLQCGVCTGYGICLNRRIIQPFQKLKDFAQRVAGGNLEIPLEMDRQNLFGAFTESFDLMRSELKKARIAEAEANNSKKELVAKLSHDIRTPVASIKAAAEVGVALAGEEKIRDNYIQIIRKADQINALVTNLFTATVEELGQLTVTPTDMESTELKTLLENADYLHRGRIPDIPECFLYADKLRLQQVFDNLFSNSYKYACQSAASDFPEKISGDSRIDVTVGREDGFLTVSIEDDGGGVSPEEIPLIKEKFKRGSNTKGREGAGLGLYLSDYFMKEMHGKLFIQNGRHGLKVTLWIALSGII